MAKLIRLLPKTARATLDGEANAWIVRLTSGESSEADHAAFRLWRDQSDAHRQAIHRARTDWLLIGEALPRIDARVAERRAWPKIMLPIAASLLLAIGLGGGAVRPLLHDQVTARGEQRSLTLPDGSLMRLGGGSSVDIDYTATGRRVRLTEGRVLISVRHDARVPFTVEAGDATYRDVGTVFEVSRDGDRSRVVTAEGVVDAIAGGVTRRVAAGRQVRVAGGVAGPVLPANVAAELGWTRGRLTFEDRSLREIVAALADHYPGRILLLGNAGNERLRASIDLDHIDEWLDAMAQGGDRSVRRFAGMTLLY